MGNKSLSSIPSWSVLEVLLWFPSVMDYDWSCKPNKPFSPTLLLVLSVIESKVIQLHSLFPLLCLLY